MPVTVPAHQAPVLPIKILWPSWFSGQALIWGSMAPDFEFFVKGRAIWGIGHTVIGQFVFCLPVSLAMLWVVSRFVARPVVLLLPDAGSFHLHDYRVLADTPRRPGYWLKAVPSALVGSFSHIFWDGFTHDGGWFAQRLGYDRAIWFHAGARAISVCNALQYASTVIGALVTLLLLEYIGRHRLLLRWAGEAEEATPKPSARSALLLLLPTLLFALIGFLVMYALMRPPHATPGTPFWIALLMRTIDCGFVGLCIGSVLSMRQMQAESAKSSALRP